MGNPGLTEEQKQEAADAYAAHGGNISHAAKSLGMDRKTFRNRVTRAAEAGLISTEPVLPGFRIAKVSTTQDADGFVQKTHIQQKPEAGEQFVLPEGHRIKGVSALVDADGRVLQQWTKTKEGELDPIWVAEKIKGVFEGLEVRSPAVHIPDTDSDRLSVYILTDWHIGLFAYGRETGGPDWDLSIARDVISGAMHELIEQTPKSRRAVVLGLGDLLHADNAANRTERSGNPLDVDTRFSKCVEVVIDLLADTCDAIATRHELVEASFKPGNHDPHATVGITHALRHYYRHTPGFAVDTSPNPFFWKRFGVNLIGGTHGDQAKLGQLPMIMANMRKQDWGETFTRHFHSGHVHHDFMREDGGVRCFSHRAPVAQDAYHSANGYLSGRSVKSFLYHVDKGSRGHSEIEIN